MTLELRQLGNTGLKVSPIALGSVKFGRNSAVKYPQAFEIPTIDHCASLVDLAYDQGINLLDTAAAYGISEQRLGQILATRKHQNWLICSKAGEIFKNNKSHFDFKPKSIIKSLHNSLKLLKVDCLDIFLIHSNGDDLSILQNHELLLTLDKLKQDGLIKAHGISSKTIAGGLLGVELLDCAMVTYNISDTEQLPVIQKAKELNKGILIKKGLNSGNLSCSAEKSIQFVLQNPAVSSMVIGSINPTHLKNNIGSAKNI